MTYVKWRGTPVNELNSFDYARFKIEEGLKAELERDGINPEEIEWYPDSWNMAFILNIPGLAKRWLKEQSESD